ncbi:MAG: metal-dependent hydrolase [Spirochaetes bacterium]|nr:metal-dependent hydrolase [Spirochaetota bacterium]
MDPLTHSALGAAMGGFIGGKKEGLRAPIAGLMAGASPDLDLLPTLFMEPMAKLDFHRGITHSVVFALLLSPIVAYAICRCTGSKNAKGRFLTWTLIVLCAILSHIVLDCFTTYGTRIFLPFSDYRAAISSIAIADPFFSVPIIVAAVSLFAVKKNERLKKILFAAGSVTALVYLATTVLVKMHIDSVFEDNYKKQAIEHSRYMTTPMPFSNFLWVGIAEGRDSFFTGYYSLLDRDAAISFDINPKNHEYLGDMLKNSAIKTIISLAKNFYSIEQTEAGLKLIDLRYGSLWAGSGIKEYIISYDIRNDHDKLEIIRHTRSRLSPETFKIFIKRIIGVKK